MWFALAIYFVLIVFISALILSKVIALNIEYLKLNENDDADAGAHTNSVHKTVQTTSTLTVGTDHELKSSPSIYGMTSSSAPSTYSTTALSSTSKVGTLAERRLNENVTERMTRIVVLYFCSLLLWMVILAALLVTYRMDTNLTNGSDSESESTMGIGWEFASYILILMDIVKNFVCVMLSYDYYKTYYLKRYTFGRIHSRCSQWMKCIARRRMQRMQSRKSPETEWASHLGPRSDSNPNTKTKSLKMSKINKKKSKKSSQKAPVTLVPPHHIMGHRLKSVSSPEPTSSREVQLQGSYSPTSDGDVEIVIVDTMEPVIEQTVLEEPTPEIKESVHFTVPTQSTLPMTKVLPVVEPAELVLDADTLNAVAPVPQTPPPAPHQPKLNGSACSETLSTSFRTETDIDAVVMGTVDVIDTVNGDQPDHNVRTSVEMSNQNRLSLPSGCQGTDTRNMEEILDGILEASSPEHDEHSRSLPAYSIAPSNRSTQSNRDRSTAQ